MRKTTAALAAIFFAGAAVGALRAGHQEGDARSEAVRPSGEKGGKKAMIKKRAKKAGESKRKASALYHCDHCDVSSDKTDKCPACGMQMRRL